MKNKFAGRLNLACAVVYTLLYLGFLFTFIIDFMKGEGIVACLQALFFAILCAIPCLPAMLPGFLTLVVGREMCSNNETMKREKMLIGLTILMKILLFFVFIGMGISFVSGESLYYLIYGLCMLVSVPLFCTSFIVDIVALVKNRNRRQDDEE